MKSGFVAVITLGLVVIPYAERPRGCPHTDAPPALGRALGNLPCVTSSESTYRFGGDYYRQNSVTIKTLEASPPFRVFQRSGSSRSVLAHVLVPTGAFPPSRARQRLNPGETSAP